MGGQLSIDKIDITYDERILGEYIPREDEFNCDGRQCKCYLYKYSGEHKGWLRGECNWTWGGDCSVFLDPVADPNKKIQVILRNVNGKDEYLVRLYDDQFKRVLPRFLPEELISLILTLNVIPSVCTQCRSSRDLRRLNKHNIPPNGCLHSICSTCALTNMVTQVYNHNVGRCPVPGCGEQYTADTIGESILPPPRPADAVPRNPDPGDPVPPPLSSNPLRTTANPFMSMESPRMISIGTIFNDIVDLIRDTKTKDELIVVYDQLSQLINAMSDDVFQRCINDLRVVVERHRDPIQQRINGQRQQLINEFRLWLRHLKRTIVQVRRNERTT